MTASSHIVEVRFDAKGEVANAGLVLPSPRRPRPSDLAQTGLWQRRAGPVGRRRQALPHPS